MNITIIAVGSRGDVQPYVALGLGLQAAGHRIRIAACTNFETFVRSRGLDFFSMEGNPREMLESDEGRAWLKSSRNPIRFIKGLTRMMQPFVERSLADSWAACQGADAIIYSLLALAGYHIAEKLGLPSFAALLQPLSRTRAFPNIAIPDKVRLGGTFNLLTHIFAEQLFWQPFRQPINKWRQQTLGLPPASFFAPYGRMNRQKYPFLYGYSPSVVPKPSDWRDWLHVTGYWFLDRPADWQPPAPLVDFLAAGPPPVYIGFGSTTESDPEALTTMVLKALATAGQRGVLLTGWAGLRNADLPEDVFELESVPHGWLFPQMAAVVHHGGAGTTATGLCAGVPSIVIPSQAEMYFWGQRVTDLGVGPQPIPRKQLSVERLAAAIMTAVSDKEMQRRAAALGELIRAENGVARAVEAIHRHLSSI